MSFEQELRETFLKYGFELSNKQVEQFYNYFKLLTMWNKEFNLTTIIEQSDVITKHFLDSVLTIIELKNNARIIDIGTGAGFPGIPIKIMREDIDLCLVDSLKKRTVFLKEVVKTLELDNVLVLHDRAESLAKKTVHREGYDYCVSRAVAKLNTLLEYCSPFVMVGGSVVAYKAKNTQEELLEAKNAMAVLNLKHISSNTIDIEETQSVRTIMHFMKIKPTPIDYPREQNKAKLNPL